MTIAVYAGTFDPFTNGHLTIVQQGARLFSHVRILIAVNPDKTPFLNTPTRLSIIQHRVEKMPNVSVDTTSEYVVHYARACGASVLLRGIRNGTDSVYETTLAQENLKLAPEIQTVILPTDPSLSDISSSAVREFAQQHQKKAVVPRYVDEETWYTMRRYMENELYNR